MDEANGKFRFIEFEREVLKRSEQVGRACLRGGQGILLRTLDGFAPKDSNPIRMQDDRDYG